MTVNWLAQTAVAAVIVLLLTSAYNAVGATLKSRRSVVVRGIVTFGLIWVAGFLGVSTLSALDWVRQPHVTPENVEQKARGWLDAFQIPTTKLKDSAVPGSFFVLEARLGGRPVRVYRHPDHPRYLTLALGVAPDAKQQAVLAKLTKDELATLADDLRVDLARYAKLPSRVEETDATLTVLLERRLPITDDLSEDAFIRGLDEMTYAANIASATFMADVQRLSGEGKTPHPPSAL